MSGEFIDYCTVGECGEPATTSLASRPGEAFCPAHHTRDTESGAWVSCPGCTFQCREGEWRRLVDHVWGHARHAKDELAVVDRKHRAQACRMVELVDGLQAVVTQAREAL